MSGHSKWNNIKNRKEAADAAKSKVFSNLAKLIKAAVREGKSGDPKFNASLRLLLDKARAANMTKEKIQRAIDAGLGKRNGQTIQEVLYEGFGPGGVGLLIAIQTDNPQRTAAEIRFILSRHGGSLASPGSAQYLFRKVGADDYQPAMEMRLTDQAQIKQLEELTEQLLANDDVEDVYHAATWETV